MYAPSIGTITLRVLVSLYFGPDDRAWFYEERSYSQPYTYSIYEADYNEHGDIICIVDNPGRSANSGIIGDLHRRGLIDIVDRTRQNILSNGIGKIKFGVTDFGEEVIRKIFLADPVRIVEACQSYPSWVPIDIVDVLRVDISRLPELLVSETPIIRETAGLISKWAQELSTQI